MAKKLSKEERQKKKEAELKRQKTKKIVFISSFVIALILGIIFTINTIINLQQLGVGEPDDEPATTSPNNQVEDIPVDDIQNGKLIIYNPITDISITRNSINLPAEAISIIKWNERKLEQPNNSEDVIAVSALNISGNNFICTIPSGSKITDSFLIHPDGQQDASTIYTLYSEKERIEFCALDMKEIMLKLSGGARLDANSGQFQLAVIVGNKTYKIVGTIEEPGVVLFSWDGEKTSFSIDSSIQLNDFKMVILENNKIIKELPVDGVNYGALFDFLNTDEPVANAKRVKRPYWE